MRFLGSVLVLIALSLVLLWALGHFFKLPDDFLFIIWAAILLAAMMAWSLRNKN